MIGNASASSPSAAAAWLIAAVVALAVPAVALSIGSKAAPSPETQSPPQGAPASSTMTFSAESDAFVSAEQPKQAHGELPFMRVAAQPAQAALLRFRVAGLTGPIAKATLVLSPVSGSNTGFEVRALPDVLWREDTVTHEHAPANSPTVVASSGPLIPGQWTSVDVTPLIVANGPVSFALTTAGADAVLLASRESGSTAPQLVVEPGPATSNQILPRAGDPVIAAAGDIACDPATATFSACSTQATSDLLVGSGLAAVLALGDGQDENGALDKYQASYDPTWGRLKAITRPVPGDDDYETPGAAGYYGYFGEAAGLRSRGYYSYDIGAWHVIALNSNCSEIGGCQAGSPQDQWLRADLARHRNACVLAYWHDPRFSSGPQGNDQTLDNFWNVLYSARADVVLNAHAHSYERFAPQDPFGAPDPPRGIRQFVVGTGGTPPQAVNPPVPNSEALHAGDAGVLELTLRPNGYDWRFVAAGNGRFSDSGSAACH
ncbi:MAG: DUF7594 domain-containing protein [Egibacteraceae bacterium]